MTRSRTSSRRRISTTSARKYFAAFVDERPQLLLRTSPSTALFTMQPMRPAQRKCGGYTMTTKKPKTTEHHRQAGGVKTQTPEVPWTGWHFLAEDCRLRYNDGRKVEPGRMYRAKGAPALCMNGMHASASALDALQYAPGPIICRVELTGDLIASEDLAVARCRRVLWMANATRTLHLFAVWCAERALKRERKAGYEPDPHSWNALKVKRAWLDGKATDDELAAARAAARNASWAAERTAAQYAAWAADQAAETAGWTAAQAAAQAAARNADWSAVGAPAWDAEREVQARKLESMLMALESEAAK